MTGDMPPLAVSGLAVSDVLASSARAEERPAIKVLHRLVDLYVRGYHSVDVVSPCQIPISGPAILVCNHVSSLDPMLLQWGCPRLITWMMAREYYVPGTRWLFDIIRTIPVERSGLDRAFQALAAARDGATLRRMEELSRIRQVNPDDLAACREYYKLWFTPFFGASNAASRMKGNVCAGSAESLRNKQNVDKFTFASLGNWDWTTSLSSAVVPTLLIHGERDPLPIEGARKWLRRCQTRGFSN